MSYEANPAGIGVGKFYGERSLYEGSSGVLNTDGFENTIVIDFDYSNYTRVSKIIPAGAVVVSAYADVLTAFAFSGGTSPDMEVGTDGSEATNGAGLTFTSVGTKEGTLAGTWTSPFTADTTVSIATSGAPTSVNAGKARVTIKYVFQGDLDGK